MRRLIPLVAYWLVAGVVCDVALTASAAANGKSPELGLTLGLSAFLGLCLVVIGGLVWMVGRGLIAAPPSVSLADPNEVLLASIPANHWSGWEARGGRLYLTNLALRFVPHRFNFDCSPREIPWESVRRVGSVGVNGVDVGRDDGGDAFVVEDSEAIAEAFFQIARGRADQRADLIASFRFVPEDRGRRRL